MSTANDAWQELKGEHPEAEQHWVFMAGYRQGLLDAASPALMAPSDELLKLADRWQYAADHATSSESRLSLLSAIADLCALFDAATPAASVPAADILALADKWEERAMTCCTLMCQNCGARYIDPDDLRTLVASAEQADKGEAADTPRDDENSCTDHPGYTCEEVEAAGPDAYAPEDEPTHEELMEGCSAYAEAHSRRVPVNDEAEAQTAAGVWHKWVLDEEPVLPPEWWDITRRAVAVGFRAARQGGNSDER